MKFGDFLAVYDDDIRIEVQRPAMSYENKPRNTFNANYGWLSDYYEGYTERYRNAQRRKLSVLEGLEVTRIDNGYILLNGCTTAKQRRRWNG